MDIDTLIQTITVLAIPVLLAITLHEAAHGYAARHFGDTTAYRAGRITLNPLRHIDPIGTILVPLLMLAFSNGALLFGWAKPVPVNFSRLRNPKADMLWVAAAGPLANLLMVFGWVLIKWLILDSHTGYTHFIRSMAEFGILINLVLMFLNLLPIPPLDGGRIVVSLLPDHLSTAFARIEPFGLIIIVILLVTQVLGTILMPLIYSARTLISWAVGV